MDTEKRSTVKGMFGQSIIWHVLSYQEPFISFSTTTNQIHHSLVPHFPNSSCLCLTKSKPLTKKLAFPKPLTKYNVKTILIPRNQLAHKIYEIDQTSDTKVTCTSHIRYQKHPKSNIPQTKLYLCLCLSPTSFTSLLHLSVSTHSS